MVLLIECYCQIVGSSLPSVWSTTSLTFFFDISNQMILIVTITFVFWYMHETWTDMLKLLNHFIHQGSLSRRECNCPHSACWTPQMDGLYCRICPGRRESLFDVDCGKEDVNEMKLLYGVIWKEGIVMLRGYWFSWPPIFQDYNPHKTFHEDIVVKQDIPLLREEFCVKVFNYFRNDYLVTNSPGKCILKNVKFPAQFPLYCWFLTNSLVSVLK